MVGQLHFIYCGYLFSIHHYTADVTNKINSFFGSGNGIVFLDYLYCYSFSSKLINCNHGSISCNPIKDIAGVICSGNDNSFVCIHTYFYPLKLSGSGNNCTNGEVRLISTYRRSEGRVEVCHNNQWGTICGNSWYGNSTQVACSQLGYGGENSQRVYPYFGYTSKPIWLSNVDCEGDESSLFDCSKNIGSIGCSHSQDVRIRCFCEYLYACKTF